MGHTGSGIGDFGGPQSRQSGPGPDLGAGTRSGDRGRGRDRGQRDGRGRRRSAPEDRGFPRTPDSPGTRNPQTPGPADDQPAPQSEQQIEADRVARQAEVRRMGRGQTILGAAARLGEGVGPNIHRRTLGGL